MYRVGVCGESQVRMAKRVLSSANQGERTQRKPLWPNTSLDLRLVYLDTCTEYSIFRYLD